MGKPWYKKWWGITLIVLFLWPFFLTYWIWKRNWDKKARITVIVVFWLFIWAIIAGSSSPTGQKSLQEGYKAGKKANLAPQVSSVPTPTAGATSAQTNNATPNTTQVVPQQSTKSSTNDNLKNDDLKKLFAEIDSAKPDDIIFSVNTESGHMQAHRENEGDNDWIVIEIMNRWPEIFVESSLKSITRDFIFQVYHSGYKIKQAGITINGARGKYYRVFVGNNQAKTLAGKDWDYLMPTNFYKWVKEVETSRNEERVNATFIEESIK